MHIHALIKTLKNLRQPKVMGKFVFSELKAELEELQQKKQQKEEGVVNEGLNLNEIEGGQLNNNYKHFQG